MVVGAYALAAHGHPRGTGDIDIWVRPSAENGQRFFRAMAKFGAPLSGIAPEEFAAEGMEFQVGLAPLRIDILTSITGVAFDEAWSNRVSIDLAGSKTDVIGRDDLLRNKQATGRAKDAVDASLLAGQLPH